jgi:hypothetical protein
MMDRFESLSPCPSLVQLLTSAKVTIEVSVQPKEKEDKKAKSEPVTPKEAAA